jgi:ribosome-associated protein
MQNKDQMARKNAFLAGGEPALAREPKAAYTEGMIRVTGTIMIDEEEIHQQFIRASGPGGQNVNKVATAVQLRFDVAHSPSLPEDVRECLTRLAGKRMTQEGYLIINARRFRTQEQNRQDSVVRLVGLIRQAAQRPKIRKRTKPTQASKERRLESKHHRSKIKDLRRAEPE